MDLCVHFGKSAFIVFISSLYLYFGFSNKHFSIQFNSITPNVRQLHWLTDCSFPNYWFIVV